MKGRYRPGDIVKVVLNEERGGGKPRWILVLSDLQEECGRWFYLCVAISTRFPEPPPAINVPLPWHPQGQASTGLRSAARRFGLGEEDGAWIDRPS